MDSLLVLDPGNSTGWLYRNSQGNKIGGTIVEDRCAVAQLIRRLHPDKILYETFQLYPSKAQKMMWNSFYPVEIIGIIELIRLEENIPVVHLTPSVKKFSCVHSWTDIQIESGVITEHVKDTARLLDYYERNLEKKPPQ